MKHTLRMTVCAAAVAFAVPALAQTTGSTPPASGTAAPASGANASASDTSGTSMSKPMHHHHGMRHMRHRGMTSSRSGTGDSETARLNAQSLQQARGSSAATTGGTGMTPGTGTGTTAGTGTSSGSSMPAGNMAPPAAGGTGMSAPSGGTGMTSPAPGSTPSPATH